MSVILFHHKRGNNNATKTINPERKIPYLGFTEAWSYTKRDCRDYWCTSINNLYEEIQRNKDLSTGEYHYAFAQTKAQRRQQNKAKYSVFTSKIKTYIKIKLKADWSPEQIAGRMKMDIGLCICHETIYRYIYYNKSRGGRLYTYLRHKNKKYHSRSNSYQRRGIILDRISIDIAPKDRRKEEPYR